MVRARALCPGVARDPRKFVSASKAPPHEHPHQRRSGRVSSVRTVQANCASLRSNCASWLAPSARLEAWAPSVSPCNDGCRTALCTCTDRDARIGSLEVAATALRQPGRPMPLPSERANDDHTRARAGRLARCTRREVSGRAQAARARARPTPTASDRPALHFRKTLQRWAPRDVEPSIVAVISARPAAVNQHLRCGTTVALDA